jgi:hypothetical protein
MVKAANSEQLFAGVPNGDAKRLEFLQSIKELVPGTVSRQQMPSIVDLLSLIDYALAEGFAILPNGGAAKLRRSRSLLEAGLIAVLARCTYSHFGLDKLKDVLLQSETCVITTNYDFLPDLAIRPLLSEKAAVDYGMPWRDPMNGTVVQRPEKPDFRLFKLHGSVNWLGCPFCENIYVNQSANIALLDTDDDKNQYGEATTCHCGYAPLRRVIVSPSLSRGAYQTQLRTIHLAALEALRTATEVYIVGYSLPIEDLMVRSLFLRGISNQPPKIKLHVYQVSDEARFRYDMHFPDYEYFTSGFDGFVSTLCV